MLAETTLPKKLPIFDEGALTLKSLLISWYATDKPAVTVTSTCSVLKTKQMQKSLETKKNK